MKKEILPWTIERLQEMVSLVEFGEYQREPSVWNSKKKRRLIDSILRGFDISSIYFYLKDTGQYECIDGRQRINAILSFLGANLGDDGGQLDNHFVFQSTDELLGESELKDFEGKRFAPLVEDEKGKFFSKPQQKQFLDYPLTIVLLTNLDSESDLRLMFLRLQLGAPLNAGEKLKAMQGQMRDFVFLTLGNHPYFERLNIPQRRFSKEQTAAQVALQYFSRIEKKSFRKARFEDLQRFFKEKSSLTGAEEKTIDALLTSLNRANEAIDASKHQIELKNRAMGVSLFFVLDQLYEEGKKNQFEVFFEFLEEFQKTVREQVKLGVFIEPRYRSLLKFQTYITQAAVEKYAIDGRNKLLLDYFDHYLKEGNIKEDSVD